ncbi:MAG: TetR family transcriptional regulator [Actinobacteria bacterium]|nr:MAG: TetR family transcriptional regulator [Actinomycetota bacterium]
MTIVSLRQRHTDRTRAAIAEAAMELFAERGFAATTVDDIAARADVAPRTFFRYFPTKESILFHDTETKLGMMREMLLARPIDEPAHLSLIAVFGALGEEFASDPAKSQFICRLATEEPKLLTRPRHLMIEHFEDDLVRVLAERAGTEPDLALRAMTAALLSCVGVAFNDFINHVEEALAACRIAFGG